MDRLPDHLFTDADNTLWDTNGVFEAAQLHLLDDVERLSGPVSANADRLAFLRKFDQEIASAHPDGLRYPIEDLIEALASSLCVAKPFRLAERDTLRIRRDYYMHLKRRPRLRWGVRKTIETLAQAGTPIWVVSEGAENRVKASLTEHELAPFIGRIVSGKKTPELFKALAAEVPRRKSILMVGDQLDRDILPAKAAGLQTAYFPGGFEPTWTELAHRAEADVTISNYVQILKLFRPGLAA